MDSVRIREVVSLGENPLAARVCYLSLLCQWITREVPLAATMTLLERANNQSRKEPFGRDVGGRADNDDQKCACNIVTRHLGQVSARRQLPPLRTLLHDAGGTGKSKVIHMVTASLIDGKTPHSIVMVTCMRRRPGYHCADESETPPILAGLRVPYN